MSAKSIFNPILTNLLLELIDLFSKKLYFTKQFKE